MNLNIPSENWKSRKAQEREELAAGKITVEDCCMEQLFPDEFIERTDAKLKSFILSISECVSTSSGYPSIMNAIKSLVIDLNQINDDFDGSVIETGEREDICDFIDSVIIEHKIDIEALAIFHGCERDELTDEWRDW